MEVVAVPHIQDGNLNLVLFIRALDMERAQSIDDIVILADLDVVG